MPKYYVMSGNCRLIVDRPDAKTAAESMVLRAKHFESPFKDRVVISEMGFNPYNENIADPSAIIFNTQEVAKARLAEEDNLENEYPNDENDDDYWG